MKKLAIVFAVGAAALMGSSVGQCRRQFGEVEIFDGCHAIADCHAIPDRHQFAPSAIGHWRGHHHHHATGATVTTGRTTTATTTTRRARYGYYGGPRYYGGGPGVTFSFGSGGYRGW